MTLTPLLEISAERKEQEARRAKDLSDAERGLGRHAWLLVPLCGAWVLAGYALIGLAFHLTDADRAQAAFLGGVLVGNAGPAFTVILHHWRSAQAAGR